MGKILCATRGGEASVRTENKAIALAKARGDELVFLYVVDMDFMERVHADFVVDMEKSVAHMGEFLLTMARERAQAQGVEPTLMVREGHTQPEIKQAVRDIGANLVVLGRPIGTEDVFDAKALRTFADEIEAETDAGTLIV